jgi:glycosyltransferase involved in cell wall biosynthesis
MRILFASLVEGLWGGSEVLWSQAAQFGAQRGDCVAAFFPFYKDTAHTREMGACGVQLHFGTPTPKRWWYRLGRHRLDRAGFFLNAIEDTKPQLIIINQGGTRDGLPEIAACQRLGLPYAILNQAVEPLAYPDPVWRELRRAFESARHVWCVSSENLAALRAYLSLPLPRAEAIANAYACPYQIEMPWPDAPDFRLAIVGRLEVHQKAHDLLFDALSLRPWGQRGLKVTLFGEGPAIEQLKVRRAQQGLDFVNITGRSVSVTEIWRTHHALILPSRFEGQSLAMLEAMLHGRPVLCTPVGGTAGVVIDGKTGFLAETIDQVPALARMIDRAWDQRSLWAQIGTEARRHIQNVVSPAPGADFIARINQIVAQPSGVR